MPIDESALQNMFTTKPLSFTLTVLLENNKKPEKKREANDVFRYGFKYPDKVTSAFMIRDLGTLAGAAAIKYPLKGTSWVSHKVGAAKTADKLGKTATKVGNFAKKVSAGKYTRLAGKWFPATGFLADSIDAYEGTKGWDLAVVNNAAWLYAPVGLINSLPGLYNLGIDFALWATGNKNLWKDKKLEHDTIYDAMRAAVIDPASHERIRQLDDANYKRDVENFKKGNYVTSTPLSTHIRF